MLYVIIQLICYLSRVTCRDISMTQCNLVASYVGFGGSCCLHLLCSEDVGIFLLNSGK